MDWTYLLPNLAQADVLDLTAENGLAARCRRVVVADPAGLPPVGEQFDFVVLGGILDRSPSSEKVGLLRRAAQYLGPEGRAYITGRNRSLPVRLHELLSRSSDPDNPPAASGLTYAAWRRTLARAGLRFHAVYWIEPSCASPRHWIRLERPGPARYYLSLPLHHEGLIARLRLALLRALSAVGAARFFARNFMIVAKAVGPS